MNQVMKHIVEVAFRLSAWDREKTAALSANKRPPPVPKMVVDSMRCMVGKKEPSPTGGLFDDASEEEHHRIVRTSVTLDWFARAGCPIVSLDEQTARGFAAAEPPAEREPLQWPLGVVYGLSIGQGAILVRHRMVPTRMPDNMRPHFMMDDGAVPMEAWTAGVAAYPAEALANLTSNVGAALVKRPDGLRIEERHPSRQAARKQGLNPNHVPNVEFVIGSEIALAAPRGHAQSDESSGAGHAMKVRTIVSPHWTHQVCGVGRSERRLQWIATHWRGPEDAPVSVHATRVLGSRGKK